MTTCSRAVWTVCREMPNRVQKSSWGQLSKDLWSNIIAMTKPNWDAASHIGADTYHGNIEHFYSLRHVCKMFDSIFKDNPHFESSLCLRDGLEGQDLCGMLDWIEGHGKNVLTMVAACGSPFLEAALGALRSHQGQNESTALTVFHASREVIPLIAPQPLHNEVLLLLSPFMSLSSCRLDLGENRCGPLFSLAQLQNLPCLTQLTLTGGNFDSLQAAQHLTYLSIQNANAVCDEDCACVTSLFELRLNDACISNFHTYGVCACSHLQVLCCVKSQIQATDKAEAMSLCKNDVAHIPISLSRLTCLTKLEFLYANKAAQHDLGWLAQLPSLRNIHGCLHVQVGLFPQSLQALSNLVHLQLWNDKSGGVFEFALDWAKLSSLKTLRIGLQFTTKLPLTNLARLKQLRQVLFFVRGDITADTTAQIAMLARRLALIRPNVFMLVKPFGPSI